MLAILCPGQGSQSAGCLTPWIESVWGRELLTEWLAASDAPDLLALGTDLEADVVDTAVAQPLLVALGLLSLQSLTPPSSETLLVGHSIGEFTAAAAAGVLTPADAIRLAAVRGAGMAAASAVSPSGMTAILGGDQSDVIAAIERAGAVVANVNAPGQIVAAGTVAALAAFAEDAPARARLRPLSVAGAFHTELMATAVPALKSAAGAVTFATPTARWLSNADGFQVVDPDEIRLRLISQTTAAVRFDLCLDSLAAAGVTACVELAPAGTLTAIVRRALPDVEAIAIKTPDDIAAAREIIARHTTHSAALDSIRIVVAPANGTWQQAAPTGATGLDLVQLGAVTTRLEPVAVTAPADLLVVEWLAHDGDPVREGQPLARLAEAIR